MRTRYVLLIIAVVVVLGIGSCSFWLFRQFQTLSGPANTFATDATAELAPGWTQESLEKLGTPEFYKAMTAQGDAGLQKFRQLGALTAPASCGGTSIKVSSSEGTTAGVTCAATFATGRATLTYVLKLQGDSSWKISSLRVTL